MPDLIRVARAPDGSLTYAIPLGPERLPAVPPAELLGAWALARQAAAGRHWGRPRRLRFQRPGGAPTDIAIADPDAGAWAEAIDQGVGLETLGGLSLCLRLLALVEAMARLPWLAGLFAVTAEGIELHPTLLAAAAALPLDPAARFDEAGLHRLLSRPLPRGRAAPRHSPVPPPMLSGGRTA